VIQYCARLETIRAHRCSTTGKLIRDDRRACGRVEGGPVEVTAELTSMHQRELSLFENLRWSPRYLAETERYGSLRRSCFAPTSHRGVHYRSFLSSSRGVFSLGFQILRTTEANNQLIERGVLSLVVERSPSAPCRVPARPLLCAGRNNASRSLFDHGRINPHNRQLGRNEVPST